jgi:hypothetical protein
MQDLPKSSRRSFLKSAAYTAAAMSIPAKGAGSNGQPRERLHEFDYADVRLTGGQLRDQFDRIYKSYLALDNDRLLKVYRQRAGLPAPGEDMGGWYDTEGFVPGHTLGQYISGLARYARATGDAAAYPDLRQRLVQMDILSPAKKQRRPGLVTFWTSMKSA